MQSLVLHVQRLVSDERGQDILEYALLSAFIALVAIAGIKAAGVQIGPIFDAITAAIPA